ncbi:hypothetical protein [Streptomyces sp. LUP47B]|uniref:hypothetical protein n=1 Tax=Streptomyces sp. LUP47B TaxID=1890286 RepID=UPI000851C31F|nr:hypothetical protein [Streptomyces sp. LUP47B]
MGEEELVYRAWLCRRYLSLRELALRDGPDTVAELEAIAGSAFDAAVRDRLTALARRLGVDARVVASRVVPIPVSGAAGHAHAGRIYACPGGSCARREVRAPGDPVPVCSLGERGPLEPRPV